MHSFCFLSGKCPFHECLLLATICKCASNFRTTTHLFAVAKFKEDLTLICNCEVLVFFNYLT